MDKMIVKRASTMIDFPYSDMGDDLVGKQMTGLEGETICFEVEKGAGCVSVEAYVDYGKNGREYDPSYFVNLFDDIAKRIGDDAGHSDIHYTFKAS